MPKRHHRGKPSRGPRRRPADRWATQRREQVRPDLVDEVAAALATGEPLDLLALASGFLAATDPRERSPFGLRDEPSLPPREEIVETFFEIPLPETSALLAAIAGLSADDVLRARVRRETAAERTRSPAGSPGWTGRGRTTAPCRWQTCWGTARTSCSA